MRRRASPCRTMGSWTRSSAPRTPSAPCTSSTPRPSTGSPTSCAARSSRASSSPVRRCARSRSPSRSASPGRPCARHWRCWSPRAWPPASPTAGSSVASPDPDSVRDVSRASGGARDRRRPPLADGRARRRATPSVWPSPTTSAPWPRTRRTRSSTSATSPSTSASSASPSRRGWSRWPSPSSPSCGWRSPRSTGYDATPATRPAPTTTCSTCSSPVTSDAAVTELDDHLGGAEDAIIERLDLD